MTFTTIFLATIVLGGFLFWGLLRYLNGPSDDLLLRVRLREKAEPIINKYQTLLRQSEANDYILTRKSSDDLGHISTFAREYLAIHRAFRSLNEQAKKEGLEGSSKKTDKILRMLKQCEEKSLSFHAKYIELHRMTFDKVLKPI